MMPATKCIQRAAIRKFVLKSWGKLICGPKSDARAELAMIPPENSPLAPPLTEKKCGVRRQIAHAGDCTQPLTKRNHRHLLKQCGKSRFVNFRGENLKGAPYRTRSYLSGGAALRNQGGEEAGCPPVILSRKREEPAAACASSIAVLRIKGDRLWKAVRRRRTFMSHSSTQPARSV